MPKNRMAIASKMRNPELVFHFVSDTSSQKITPSHHINRWRLLAWKMPPSCPHFQRALLPKISLQLRIIWSATS